MAFSTFRIPDFNGGQNDFFDARLIQDNEAIETRNCLIDTIGRLSPRGGQADLNSVELAGGIQGLHAYYNGATRRLVAVAGGKAYYGDHVGTFTEFKTGLSTTNNFGFANCINYMVACDGENAPWKWDGVEANAPTALANAPVTSKNPVYHAEKLFVAVTNDQLRFSGDFHPEEWPEVNYWEFGKGDGDKLSAHIVFMNSLLVFKNYGFWDLQGTSLSNMRANVRDKKNGAVGQRAVIVDDVYAYFIGYRGIFKWDGYQATNLTESKIPKLWDTVNQANLHKASATKDPITGMILFSVPIDDSTVPNFVIAWDPVLKSFWPWDSISSSCFLSFNTGSDIRFYSGHPTEGKIVRQSSGSNDRGEAIISYFITKEHDAKSPEYIKKYKKAYVADATGIGEAVFSYRLNGGDWVSPTALSDRLDVRRYSIGQNARYFQARIMHSTLDTKFSIRNLAIRFFPKKAQ